ncbi:hypothetical protein DER46DRAFT_612951 [Fusarium sp. MPI-SDFR-AT-0072]|nr:hypothetical protein DER46DRAFT_612951 [Fusarium sp. MPI-SDFR-AT-0072]
MALEYSKFPVKAGELRLVSLDSWAADITKAEWKLRVVSLHDPLTRATTVFHIDGERQSTRSLSNHIQTSLSRLSKLAMGNLSSTVHGW